MISRDELDGLVQRPTESLNVEVKRWLSTSDPNHVAKLIKGLFALYNRNGGFFIVGFDDRTGAPDTPNTPANVREEFHVDKIQELVSRFASRPFEVEIDFRERDGQMYPVVVVPTGVRTVVAAKRELPSSSSGLLIREGDVYFRTLGANGRISSARARPTDWDDILTICFDNREADLARFIRRHLSGNLPEILRALGLSQVRSQRGVPETSLGFATGLAEEIGAGRLWFSPGSSGTGGLPARAARVLREGAHRFDEVARERADLAASPELSLGRWSIALCIAPEKASEISTTDFLGAVEAANPDLTGWPIWLVSSRFSQPQDRPRMFNNAWESLIVSLAGWGSHLEFQRISARGEFFLSRVLQDDLRSLADPTIGKALDPVLVILRVAEAIAVGLAFALALGWSSETSVLGFCFEWSDLKGRRLKTWANPTATSHPWDGEAYDTSVESFVEVPLGTAASAIAPYVHRATARLFAAFGGTVIPLADVENWVRRLIERRLS